LRSPVSSRFLARLRGDSETASWTEPENLNPNVRFLQLLDGRSLYLCSALIPARSGQSKGFGEDQIDLLNTPRTSWQDRVTIKVRPAGARKVSLDPYPFDQDQLPVAIPVRIIDSAETPTAPLPLWWRRPQPQQIQFELRGL